MHPASGRRVGRYTVLELLGAGGMGEVYRARDAALNRDIALKILPEAFASDRERRVRFDREAQVLASLNHPHIAQIYGIEESGGTRALAMELVEGSTLADLMRMARIAMPDALALGVQIADALDAAHERGIVHRDLKPANIKVTPDGQVKVLDFGLAKALEPSASSIQTIDVMMSPTVTSPATQLGVILGTAGYMSPEQAKGLPVDRRSDIWAFGVILFEMLTGRRAFEGETVTDILAAIVTRDPAWDALPPHTPEAVVRLLRRCLDRDRRRRLAAAGEIRFQLEEASSGGASLPARAHGPGVATRSRVWSLLPWAMALLLGTAAAVVGWQLWRQPHPAIERLSIDTTPGTTLSLGLRPAIAVSPDGRRLAFAAASRGATRLYVRRRDRFDAVVLAGTEGASEPVFSPDGEWIAFFAGTKLNKVPAAGGPVVPLTTENEPRGLSWDVADTLTYSSSTGGVFRVSAAGGAPARITQVAPEKSERSHRWPQMLPGGAVVLFTVGSVDSPDDYSGANIDAAVVATGDRRRLVTAASTARYVPTGHLVFARNRVLYAVRFDARTLTVSGSSVPIVQGVEDDPTTGATHFATSAAGVLAYVAGPTEGGSRRLMWCRATASGRRPMCRLARIWIRDCQPTALAWQCASSRRTPRTSGCTTSRAARSRASPSAGPTCRPCGRPTARRSITSLWLRTVAPVRRCGANPRTAAGGRNRSPKCPTGRTSGG
jgi:eukaryotic-like serine/threonine-protein kinase